METLESLAKGGRALLHASDNAAQTHYHFNSWDREVADWLDKNYPGSGYSAQWSAQSASPLVTGGGYDNGMRAWDLFRAAVQRRLAFLGSLGTTIQVTKDGGPHAKSPSDPGTVFLVHGHDQAAREKVARFLERLNLKPIILHEQPSKGRTIIEKFTDHAGVAFAVVLLTADDVGGVKGGNPKDQSPRARQNVVLELGYFLAKLGRDRVCALHESGVELPSDYSGVVYVTFDQADAWRLQLAKEMKAVGLAVDLNHAV